ncbi:MAG: SEL1-like repeat protein [Magnetococcales bacterium]|nr:SEL1-like repeat protein [Magnetococcales bacterium]
MSIGFGLFVLALVILYIYDQSSNKEFYEGMSAMKSGDFSTAFPKMYQLAEQGNAKAQGSRLKAQGAVGWMYEEGKGVPQNEQESVKWYKKAAAQEGYTDVQNG